MGEVVGAFLWRVELEDATDGVPQIMDGALGGGAQVRLELGESEPRFDADRGAFCAAVDRLKLVSSLLMAEASARN